MNTQFNLIAEKEFKTNLESVLDSKGLGYILNSLIDICNEKSQHVAENWQDNKLASAWDRTASKIERNMQTIEQICPNW